MDEEDGSERSYNRKAIECHERVLKIAKETGDRAGEGRAYGNLGSAYGSRGDYGKAIEYHEKRLIIAKEVGDRAAEERAYGELGNAYHSMGHCGKAIEYHEKRLIIAKEVGDRAAEGRAYGNLGIPYQSQGEPLKAIEYYEKHLKIAIEIGDRFGEGQAYANLGIAYDSLMDYQKAIEYHEKHLKIAKEISNLAEEGRAYGNLGNYYESRGDHRKAIEYHEKRLKIAKDVDDRAGEGRAYGNLGNVYESLCDYQKAIEYHNKHLTIAIENKNQKVKGDVYGCLGNAYQSLGDYGKAIDCYRKHLEIAREIGDRVGEGGAYGGLGNCYLSQGKNKKADIYYNKQLEFAREIGDQAREGRAYGNLGLVRLSLGEYPKAIEYLEKNLKIAIESGDQDGERKAYGNIGNAYQSQGAYEKAIHYCEKNLKMEKEFSDRAEEGTAYHNIGNVYFSLEQFENAVVYFYSAIKIFDSLRSLIESEDNWKITFREVYEKTYRALCRSLLKIGKFDKAVFVAEHGRAQALCDNLLTRYKLPASLSAALIDTEKTISRLFTELSTPAIFLGVEELTINIWFLRRVKKMAFRQGKLDGDRREEDPIKALRRTALEKIKAGDNVRCEDRTFGELENECPSVREVCGESVRNPSLPLSENPFKPFYDSVIRPIADLLEPQDDELIIVPDDELCFIPWAAVIESIRIRTIPSLTSYQLISSAPESHHKEKGALLVGNPCLDQVNLEQPITPLPFAQKEVEMIASILNTSPLTGSEATKAEVIKQMSSVGLIHIAAHGNSHAGEILLAPNPGWTSNFPQEKDYVLKMSDVKEANLRARLVVLSCCHTGKGRKLKGEGVVGIARAFLAAGARSVLVTLWPIDDEATMVFMKSFYQHLKEGKTASTAVHQSMKSLRESEKFSEMRHWAPFQLIGDDVKIEFDVEDDMKK